MRAILYSVIATFLIAATSAPALARNIQTVIVAGGCFWCVESDFDKVKGVIDTKSGYTGGTTRNPTYKKVTKGGTGHYEAVQVKYDADVVTFETLMDVFWHSVDPTDAGGQFCDRGESYRTAIFATTPQQAAIAEATKKQAQQELGKKIVTPIRMASKFYLAEDYHQDYYKSSDIVLTRFGPLTKAAAYKRYRKGCGRDKRLRQVWGDAAYSGS